MLLTSTSYCILCTFMKINNIAFKYITEKYYIFFVSAVGFLCAKDAGKMFAELTTLIL